MSHYETFTAGLKLRPEVGLLSVGKRSVIYSVIYLFIPRLQEAADLEETHWSIREICKSSRQTGIVSPRAACADSLSSVNVYSRKTEKKLGCSRQKLLGSPCTSSASEQEEMKHRREPVANTEVA